MMLDVNNPDLVKTYLDEMFVEDYDVFESNPGYLSVLNGEIFKVVNTDKAAYNLDILATVGYFSPINEDTTLPSTNPVSGFAKTIKVQDWGDAEPISKNFFDDDQHDAVAEIVKSMAQSARATAERASMAIFRGAFTTTLTNDGAAWIGSHTTLKNQTVTNILTDSTGQVNPDLNANSLFDMQVAFNNQPNQAGVVFPQVMKYLIVPTALFKHATELVESEKLADTANNNMNIYSSKYQIYVLHNPFMGAAYGGSDTAWFGLSKNHSIMRLFREGFESALTPWNVGINRTMYYQAFYREQYFVKDYYGAVGSKGTNAA